MRDIQSTTQGLASRVQVATEMAMMACPLEREHWFLLQEFQ